MNVIAVYQGESVMSVSSACINIRYITGLSATLLTYKNMALEAKKALGVCKRRTLCYDKKALKLHE